MRYRQGEFKEGDTLVVIDPVMDNDWDILVLQESYGRSRSIDATLICEDGEQCNVKHDLFNIPFADVFCDIYKVKNEF